MTTKPKADRPAAQPGTPLGIADVRIAIEALRQEDVEPALAILAELHDSMAEREAPAPNCPVCDEAVDTNQAGNVIAIHSMCLPKVRFGEAPAQTAGTGAEEKSAVAAWQREANFDRDVTSFEDIFVLGWKARARLSSAAFSPEPAATMQELVKFIAENADFGPLMPNDIEGIAQLMQKWAAIRAKASAEKEQK
jgi:hypothetical protein